MTDDNLNHNERAELEEYRREKSMREDQARAEALSRSSVLSRGDKKPPKAFAIIVGLLVIAILFGAFSSDRKKTKEREEFQPVTQRSAPDLPPPPPPPKEEVKAPPPPPPPPPPVDKKDDKMLLARLKSKIMIKSDEVQLGTGQPPVVGMTEEEYLAAANGQAPGAGGSNQYNDPPQRNSSVGTWNDPNSRYYNNITSAGVDTAQAKQLRDLDYKILQGKFVDGVLETAIRSDLPGMIRAVVTSPVYSEQGRNVLLPYGTRLIGTYNSQLRKGQAQVMVVWQRAIRPDGIDVAINSPGSDQLGQAGLGGHVDHHFAQIFGVAALTSLIGAAVPTYHNNGDGDDAEERYRTDVSRSAARVSNRILDEYASIPPTVYVDQGTKIKIFVNRDLDFTQVMRRQRDAAEPAFVMIH